LVFDLMVLLSKQKLKDFSVFFFIQPNKRREQKCIAFTSISLIPNNISNLLYLSTLCLFLHSFSPLYLFSISSYNQTHFWSVLILCNFSLLCAEESHVCLICDIIYASIIYSKHNLTYNLVLSGHWRTHSKVIAIILEQLN
jgi:hypothetical protein